MGLITKTNKIFYKYKKSSFSTILGFTTVASYPYYHNSQMDKSSSLLSSLQYPHLSLCSIISEVVSQIMNPFSVPSPLFVLWNYVLQGWHGHGHLDTRAAVATWVRYTLSFPIGKGRGS